MTPAPQFALRPHRGVTLRNSAGRTWPYFLAVLAAIGVIAGAELYAVATRGRVADHSAPTTLAPTTTGTAAVTPARTAPAPAASVGSVDNPATDAVLGSRIAISGWALDPAGIRGVEIRIDGRRFSARYAVSRPDVARVMPGYPDSASSGFEFTGDLSALPPAFGTDHRPLQVVAIARDGRETVLATKDLVEASALTRWQTLTSAASRSVSGTTFHLLPALSGIALGGALDLDRWYAPYLSATMRAGMRVPILYLRTTKGATRDYVFDPDWDIQRRCGERRIAEDSLRATIAHAIAHRVPVLFTLNGGVWASAVCDVPEWDVNDHLEQDIANCQWNEKNEVMPDDYLRQLPGSQDAPDLARSLTFNVHAKNVRHYKRRNLQAAGAMIAAFAREHPDLFVGINLDPDTYLNPFFNEAQWYDYNPGTVRQFREWLRGTGPYAGQRSRDVPDLRLYRRKEPLTLAAAGALAGKHFARWDDVDPPRSFPREPKDGRPVFWDDPWTREWEIFRRHLVDLHYDELSQWLSAVGISRDRIWSSQGFMAPHASARPFAIHVTSPMKNYDTGGMSIEGAIPSHGHLGAILYGASAVNDIRMETPSSLFATFRSMDPRWAVVELNTADLRNPAAPPTYPAAYRSLRDLFNYGARFVSPMAWNGSNGVNAGKPGYVTFTAWRNTPLEDAARDFLLSHANVPLGARLWTFGTPRHADGDGWTTSEGAMTLKPGMLALTPTAGAVALVSPPELAFAPQAFASIVVGLEDPTALHGLALAARAGPDQAWREIRVAGSARWRTTPAGIAIPIEAAGMRGAFDQLRLEMQFSPGVTARLAHIALLPARSSGRTPREDRPATAGALRPPPIVRRP